MNKWMTPVLVLGLFSSTNQLWAAVSNGLAFKAQGHLAVVYHFEDGESRVESYTFQAFSKGGVYQAVTIPDVVDGAFRQYEFVTDGTSGVTSSIYKDDLQVARTNKSGKVEMVGIGLNGEVKLSPWPLPHAGAGQLNPVWVAFLSMPYFTKLDKQSAIPLFFYAPNSRELDLKTTCDFTKAAFAPHFLDSYFEFDPGKSVIQGPKGPVLADSEFIRDREFTNALYRVLAWTNISEIAFPKQFEVIKYCWTESAASRRQFECLHIMGELEAATLEFLEEVSMTNLASLTGKVHVTDSRLALSPTQFAGKPIAYRLPSAEFPTTEQLLKSPRFKELEKYVASTSRRRFGIIVLFLVTTLFPLLFLVVRKMKHKQNNNKTNL